MGNELQQDFHPNITKTGILSPTLSIIIGKYCYIIGNTIEGMISLQIREPIRIKNIMIYLNQVQGWEISSTLKHSSEKTITQYEINLSNSFAKNNEYFYIVPSGNYNYSFSIKIPFNILPSFLFFKGGKIGYIKYYLLSQIITDSGIELLDEKVIVINMSNDSIVDKPFPIEDTKEIKALFINYGSNTMRIEMDKGIYNYDKEIKFSLQIDNKNCTGTVHSVHFEIYRRVIFFSKNYKKELIEEQKINEGDFPYVTDAGELKNYEICLFSEGKVIEEYLYFYKNKIKDTVFSSVINLMNFMLPTITTSEIIKCEYKINLSLRYAGIIPDDDTQRICIPIIFSCFPGEDPSNAVAKITTEKNKCFMYLKNNALLNSNLNYFNDNKNNENVNDNNFTGFTFNDNKNYSVPEGYQDFKSILNSQNKLINQNNQNNLSNNNINNSSYQNNNQNVYPNQNIIYPNNNINEYPNYPNNVNNNVAPNISYINEYNPAPNINDNTFNLFKLDDDNKNQQYNPNEYYNSK